MDPSAPEPPTSTLQADAVVHIAAVDKTFVTGSSALTAALQGIDLDIRRGEFISLIGPSGCGKSTLLRVIGDLAAPTRGTVMVNGSQPLQRSLACRSFEAASSVAGWVAASIMKPV